KGLEETSIGQLHYPLDDQARQPMPAGGVFSPPEDGGRVCQMVLNGGKGGQVGHLSREAGRAMTRKQDGEGPQEGYGLGWATGGGTFGHGGAYATNMNVDPKRGLVTVFLVQHAGFPGKGGQAQHVFRQAAEEHFGRRGG